ncbi:hypothetical protein MTR67_017342, partial [Solanum verrucosum]
MNLRVHWQVLAQLLHVAVKYTGPMDVARHVLKFEGGGSIQGLSVYPTDVIKSVIQVDDYKNPKFSGFADAFKKIVASEGVKGIYKGFGSAMARSIPANVACFLAYEITRSSLGIPGSVTNIKNGDLGSFDTLGDVRIMWDVILEGYRGVFNVMNCKGKGRFVLGLEGWFSEELPPPGCCSIETVSGLVADLRLGLKLEDGKAMVEKISAGILSI